MKIIHQNWHDVHFSLGKKSCLKMTHTRDILKLRLVRISIKISCKKCNKICHASNNSLDTQKQTFQKSFPFIFVFISAKKIDWQYEFVHTFIIPNEWTHLRKQDVTIIAKLIYKIFFISSLPSRLLSLLYIHTRWSNH